MKEFKPFDFRKDFELITSKHLADITGINHKNIISLIEKHELDIWLTRKPNSLDDDELKECSRLNRISIRTNSYSISKSYLLTEEQCKFIICLLKNENDKIIHYKHDIVLNKFDNELFHYQERGFVYVLSKNKNQYKIGRTYNLKQRYKAIMTQSGDSSVKLIYLSDFIFEYSKLENALHKLYKDKKIIGEWYKLNKDELDELSLYIEMNGSTLYNNKNESCTKLNYYIDYEISKKLFKQISMLNSEVK